jgi:hypothetical protein
MDGSRTKHAALMEPWMLIATKHPIAELGLDGSTRGRKHLTRSGLMNIVLVGLWMWTIFFAVLFRLLAHWRS